ncbi:hypothetical protein [Endozoicomonas elysicola]|uniref:Uncharacterized protein n=1 Tax=Endozoicomonas elysicola TaxID=305900 RepID=A0A081K9X2_9GAMM|nr:hypothetical protein [Endozoicomonas elysicola]KEI70948.1 hypothetical protein GV64_09540 [Endozoicomonas elysicola]
MMTTLIQRLKALSASLLIFLSAGWSDENRVQTAAPLSSLLDQAMYIDPETIISIQDKYHEFIEFSDQKRGEEQMTTGDELLEIGKIIGMGVIAAILYGVIHDLITTQINFAYFSDLYLTHHGVVTRDFFPLVYNSESRILYSLLWGTIATWWIGLPIGGLSALSARLDARALKMTWHDLVYPVATMMGTNLAIALLAGGLTYLISGSSFLTVASMHNSSYLFGIIGGIILPIYIYASRPPETSTIKKQCAGFTEDILILFKDHPDSSEIQALVKSHLNSPYGNCKHAM